VVLVSGLRGLGTAQTPGITRQDREAVMFAGFDLARRTTLMSPMKLGIQRGAGALVEFARGGDLFEPSASITPIRLAIRQSPPPGRG